jgi:hypothetical protein
MITENLIIFCNSTNITPSTEIYINYGFKNCQTENDITALKEVYKELLQRECPIEQLKKAMVSNSLYELCSAFKLKGQAWKKIKKMPELFDNYFPKN